MITCQLSTPDNVPIALLPVFFMLESARGFPRIAMSSSYRLLLLEFFA